MEVPFFCLQRKLVHESQIKCWDFAGCPSDGRHSVALYRTKISPAKSVASPPKEISAQSFVLVNDEGVPSGVFGFDKDGNPSITCWTSQAKLSGERERKRTWPDFRRQHIEVLAAGQNPANSRIVGFSDNYLLNGQSFFR
jgi:hypothetical protein